MRCRWVSNDDQTGARGPETRCRGVGSTPATAWPSLVWSPRHRTASIVAPLARHAATWAVALAPVAPRHAPWPPGAWTWPRTWPTTWTWSLTGTWPTTRTWARTGTWARFRALVQAALCHCLNIPIQVLWIQAVWDSSPALHEPCCAGLLRVERDDRDHRQRLHPQVVLRPVFDKGVASTADEGAGRAGAVDDCDEHLPGDLLSRRCCGVDAFQGGRGGVCRDLLHTGCTCRTWGAPFTWFSPGSHVTCTHMHT